MTDEQLAMVDTLADTALTAAGNAKDAAALLVAAAGNTLTNAIGIEGGASLVAHAQCYRAIVVAHEEMRRSASGLPKTRRKP